MEADLAALRHVEQTILNLAQLMVDESEAVRLEVILNPAETLIRLHVAPQDVGKLIGKQGRTARSLRVILGAIGMKYQHSFFAGYCCVRELRAWAKDPHHLWDFLTRKYLMRSEIA